MSLLVVLCHVTFELGITWLAGGVDRQSHTGLIFRYCTTSEQLHVLYVSVCEGC